MKDKISVRQICFILLAYNAATKLLLYPSVAATMAGNDLIFPALFNLILQTVIIWAVGFLSSKTDRTFFELLEATFGKVTARVVYALFGLYFLFSAIVPMNEQQLLIHDAFYDTIPSLLVFLPFFFFSVYAGAKNFTNAGRCADVCLPIFVITMAFFLTTSLWQGNYSNLLPVLSQPVSKLAQSSLAGMFRFSESAFLLMFLGHYKYRRGDSLKMTFSYAAGGIAVILLMAAFYSVYGALTPSRAFLLNNISVFFPAVRFIGRVDLIAIYAFDIVILFAIVLHVQASVHCFFAAFGWENRAALSLIVNAVLVAVTFVLYHRFSYLQEAAAKWFFIPASVFAYLMPLLAFALRRERR